MLRGAAATKTQQQNKREEHAAGRSRHQDSATKQREEHAAGRSRHQDSATKQREERLRRAESKCGEVAQQLRMSARRMTMGESQVPLRT